MEFNIGDPVVVINNNEIISDEGHVVKYNPDKDFPTYDVKFDNGEVVTVLEWELISSLGLDESVIISEEVILTQPVVTEDGTIKVSINGKNYEYNSKEITPEELVRSIKGMMKYSNGKALQYLKRNADLISNTKSPLQLKLFDN